MRHGRRTRLFVSLTLACVTLACTGPLNAQISSAQKNLVDQTTNDPDYAKGIEANERNAYTEALRWFQKAADHGNAEAQEAIGILYYGGRGVAKDDAQAVLWFRKAAEQGSAVSQTILGDIYLGGGRGVEPDPVQGFAWMRKAAEQGFAKAQYILGTMFEEGLGTAPDIAQAKIWYAKAAAQGDVNAQQALDGLSK
jgi:TPR repeat protein